MGGTLSVESVPGEGSTFAFDLPLLVSPGTSQAQELTASTFTDQSILIVDPQPASQAVLARWLSGWGATVHAVSNVADAPDLARMACAFVDAEAVERLRMGGAGAAGLPPVVAMVRTGDAAPAGTTPTAITVQKPRRRAAVAAAATAALDGGRTRGTSPAADAPPVQHVLPRRVRVLVAEDNVVNQRVVQGMLRARSCEVVLAGNGREAVDAWQRSHIDLIFMDVQMPEMDGFEAVAAIRAAEAPSGRPRVPSSPSPPTRSAATPNAAWPRGWMATSPSRCVAAPWTTK